MRYSEFGGIGAWVSCQCKPSGCFTSIFISRKLQRTCQLLNTGCLKAVICIAHNQAGEWDQIWRLLITLHWSRCLPGDDAVL